jgi:uncharacterized protein (TIGR01777 family)
VKVVIAGGSGGLGRRLGADLDGRGHDVVVLTRAIRPGPHRQVLWDGRSPGPWVAELEGAALVNLCGELVDRRPTEANIRLFTSSRVEPTRALVAASAQLTEPVRVWVQASTTAIYGDAGEVELVEGAPVGVGPAQMVGVATAWEASVTGARAERLVRLRTSLVLDRGSPVMSRLVGLTRWGLGGRIGSGRQWVSWIHLEDWLGIVRRLLEGGPELDGVLHATGPVPVRNAELMSALRRAVGRPAAPPTPAALARLGAFVLRTDPALALTGRRVIPKRLQDSGFAFAYPELVAALADRVAR